MSRRNVVAIGIVGLLVIGGLALAQQERPTIVRGVAAEGGQFVITPARNNAILCETKSGKTWELRTSVNGDSVWLPLNRIDDEKVAEDWKSREKRREAEQKQ
jgi:hypothetical protein